MKHSGPYQPKLVHEQPIWYLPDTGNIVGGRGIGPLWVRDGATGTVTHPAPTAGYDTQFRRTRVTSTAVANNELGVHLPNADCCSIWRGNATGRGGFYFSCRFNVNAIPNNNVRLFVGLSTILAGLCQTASGAIANASVGLWHEPGDGGVLQLLSHTGAALTKTPLTGNPAITAGTLYEFLMIGTPGQGSVVTQLLNVELGTVIAAQNVGANLPANNVFLAPQAGLSNVANAAGGDTSFDIFSIYARPNLHLFPERSA